MATEVLLISETKIKSFTNLNENVYVDDIIPGIITTQDIDLQPMLGSKFYDGLKARVLAGTQTADETELLDNYIAPFLLNKALYHILPSIKWKLLNKSVLSPNSETATTISLEEFQYIRNDQQQTSVWYEERLRHYLVEYSNLYPEYQSPDMKGVIPDASESTTNQWSLPSTNSNGAYINQRRTTMGCNDCTDGTVYPLL